MEMDENQIRKRLLMRKSGGDTPARAGCEERGASKAAKWGSKADVLGAAAECGIRVAWMMGADDVVEGRLSGRLSRQHPGCGHCETGRASGAGLDDGAEEWPEKLAAGIARESWDKEAQQEERELVSARELDVSGLAW